MSIFYIAYGKILHFCGRSSYWWGRARLGIPWMLVQSGKWPKSHEFDLLNSTHYLPTSKWPEWTPMELSIDCDQRTLPQNIQCPQNWILLEFHGDSQSFRCWCMFIQPPSSPPSYILFNSAPPLEPITASLDPLDCSHTHTSPCPSHVFGPHCLSRRRDTSIFHSDGSRTVFLLWSIQDIVIREIDWPQYHVYRGVDRRPARYEDLNIQEFVYGALCQVIDGRDSKANKHTMLQHLRMLMEDACDLPCPNVRNFHGIVLSQLEMDCITWGDQDRIGELRQTHVQRGPAATSTPVNNKKRYCLPFQDGTCRATSGEHESPQGLVTHICAYCLPNTGSAFSHAEKDCIRKERAASKNAGQPSE